MIKLLKAYIKSNLNIIILLICTLTIAIAGAFTTMLSEYSENINYINFQKQYSSVYGCVGNSITKDELEMIKNFDSVGECHEAVSLDSFVKDSNGEKANIESYNKNILDLNKLILVSGRFPESENEAVIFNAKNSHRIGDVINREVFYDINKNGSYISKKKPLSLKVVGIVSNKIMKYGSEDGGRDKVYALLGNSFINSNESLYNVFINFKSGYKYVDKETARLVQALGLNRDKVNYNRDILQISRQVNTTYLDNPRFKKLVLAGTLFSIVTMIIYSRKRVEDMKILRVVGASKKQIMLLIGYEGFLIGLISFVMGIGLGVGLTKVIVSHVNYTFASDALYKEMPKQLHYNISFILYVLRIAVIPVIISYIYQLIKLNSDYLKRKLGSLDGVTTKLVNFSFYEKRPLSKISSVNFRKYCIYFLVPIVLLALPISNYLYVKNAHEETELKEFGNSVYSSYAQRSYGINKDNYYIPKYGFSDEDVNKINNTKSIKNVLPILKDEIIFVSNGKDISPIYNKISRGENRFSLLSLDKKDLVERKAIYDEIKIKDQNYPYVYLKESFTIE